MTLLKERGRSDDNDARAFLLSNTAEERAELLRILTNASNCATTSAISRSHNAVIRVYDESGNVIEAHDHAGDFQEP
jgi:hypothetical protein